MNKGGIQEVAPRLGARRRRRDANRVREQAAAPVAPPVLSRASEWPTRPAARLQPLATSSAGSRCRWSWRGRCPSASRGRRRRRFRSSAPRCRRWYARATRLAGDGEVVFVLPVSAASLRSLTSRERIRRPFEADGCEGSLRRAWRGIERAQLLAPLAGRRQTFRYADHALAAMATAPPAEREDHHRGAGRPAQRVGASAASRLFAEIALASENSSAPQNTDSLSPGPHIQGQRSPLVTMAGIDDATKATMLSSGVRSRRPRDGRTGSSAEGGIQGASGAAASRAAPARAPRAGRRRRASTSKSTRSMAPSGLRSRRRTRPARGGRARWTFHDSIKAEADRSSTSRELPERGARAALPELDGKTEKMYRGGKARAAPPPLLLRPPLRRRLHASARRHPPAQIA